MQYTALYFYGIRWAFTSLCDYRTAFFPSMMGLSFGRTKETNVRLLSSNHDLYGVVYSAWYFNIVSIIKW